MMVKYYKNPKQYINIYIPDDLIWLRENLLDMADVLFGGNLNKLGREALLQYYLSHKGELKNARSET